MYLHIGSDVVVRAKKTIAIIGRRGDADKSKINRNYLHKKQQNGDLINLSSNNEKSFILTDDEKVYISPISPHTLKKRSKNPDFREG
jgi:regulator of extracellular matrix RemA (YlzA/DUF370 family)